MVLDLMIHDSTCLNVRRLAGRDPRRWHLDPFLQGGHRQRAAAVPDGCIANLTASRVSTERVRKLRLFQPHEYISLDYSRQDAVRFRVKPPMAIDFAPLTITKDEPLRLEVESFVKSVATRSAPSVTGAQGLAALEVAESILGKIKEHSRLVAKTLATP